MEQQIRAFHTVKFTVTCLATVGLFSVPRSVRGVAVYMGTPPDQNLVSHGLTAGTTSEWPKVVASKTSSCVAVSKIDRATEGPAAQDSRCQVRHIICIEQQMTRVLGGGSPLQQFYGFDLFYSATINSVESLSTDSECGFLLPI